MRKLQKIEKSSPFLLLPTDPGIWTRHLLEGSNGEYVIYQLQSSSFSLDIPLPTQNGRKILFDINLKDENIDSSLDWDNLITKTEGFSGADISSLCREAAMFPLRRKLKEEGGL